MSQINFGALTMPAPVVVYDTTNPERNLENLCYVGLQIVGQLKTQGVTLPIPLHIVIENVSLSLGGGTLEEIRDAIKDLVLNNIKLAWNVGADTKTVSVDLSGAA